MMYIYNGIQIGVAFIDLDCRFNGLRFVTLLEQKINDIFLHEEHEKYLQNCNHFNKNNKSNLAQNENDDIMAGLFINEKCFLKKIFF